MSDQGVEANEDPDMDMDHDQPVEEEPVPLTDEEMLVLDPGPEAEG